MAEQKRTSRMFPGGGKGCLILLVIGLLLSCGVVVRPASEFTLANRDYVQRLRWMDVPGAARYLAPEFQDEFIEQFTGWDDLHVVDVRVTSIEFLNDGRQALTRNVLEYYLLPSVTVKTFRFEQKWSYLGGDRYHPGNWIITTAFPPFP